MIKSKKIVALSMCIIASLSMMSTPIMATAADEQPSSADIASGIEGRSDEFDPYDFIEETDDVQTDNESSQLDKSNEKSTNAKPSSKKDSANRKSVKKTAKKTEVQTKKLHLNVNNVAEPSNLTKNQIKAFIKDYTEWDDVDLDYLIECDKEINLIFLLAVARTETGGGAACVGQYNCFNIKGSNGKYRSYDSYEESIDHFIRLIKESYISPEGKYYCGTGIDDIAVHYASSYWGTYVKDIADQLYNKFIKIDP